MADEAHFLTQEKFNELTLELEKLKHEERKKIAEKLQYAKSLGDLSENAEYQEAREQQAVVEERIAKLESMLKNAQIVKDRHTDSVGMGSTIVIQKAGETATRKFKMVGSDEADMMKGQLSNHSPIGAALMGKKKGESVEVKTPAGKTVYKLVSIE